MAAETVFISSLPSVLTIHRLVTTVALKMFIHQTGRLQGSVKIVLQCFDLLVEYVPEGFHLR